MDDDTTNEALRWFVYEFCEGPTKASHALCVSASAVHNWLRAGYVLDRAKAIEAAALCDHAVSAAALLALPEQAAS